MPDLESSHYLSSIRTPFVIIFTLNFWHTYMSLLDKKAGSNPIFLGNVNLDELNGISFKKCIRQMGESVHFLKVAQTRPPHLPANVNERTKARKLQSQCGRSRYWSISVKMVPMGIKWTKWWEKPSAAPKIKTSFFLMAWWPRLGFDSDSTSPP